MNKLSVTTVINATFRVDNSADENRTFNISAEVTADSNGVSTIQSGTLDAIEGEGHADFSNYNADASATFGLYGFDGAAGRVAAIDAIDAFCNDARKEVPLMIEKITVG